MIESFEAMDPTQLLLQLLITPAATILLWVSIGIVVEHVVLRLLYKITELTPLQFDKKMIEVLRGGVTIFWFSLLGVYLAIPSMNLGAQTLLIFEQTVIGLFVFSLVVVTSRLSVGIISIYTQLSDVPSLSILQNIVRIIIFTVGFLFILDSVVGYEITPLLAAFGFGGLAVSLALQDTLMNLFSGIQLTVTRRVRTGNYVALSSGVEGYVTDINWHSTKLRHWNNNMIIIPNTQMTSAMITNYDDPNSVLLTWVDVGVSYDSDLAYVEEVSKDVMREVLREYPADAVVEDDTFVRYNTFDDSSINFGVFFYARNRVSQFLVKHEFIKRLHQRYKEEGIEIPFPIRTLHTKAPVQIERFAHELNASNGFTGKGNETPGQGDAS
jgi:small-conductance mechanosensitive channel